MKMNMQMIKVLSATRKYLLYILIVLYPVFVFSFSASSFVVPKEILLAILGGAAIVIMTAESVIQKSLSFKVGKFDLAILLIALAYAVSGIFAAPNKMEAFFFPGTATIVIASAVIYFLINQLDAKGKEETSLALVISAVLLSIVILFAQVGVLAKIPQLPDFVKDINFNPMGGSLPSAIYLVVVFAILGEYIYKKRDVVYRVFAAVSALIVILGLVLLIKNALPGQPQQLRLPDLNTSWQIAVETIKVSPIFGAGTGNYLTVFTRFRPVSYNSSDLWQVRFTTGSNFYLTAFTELGFIGIAAFAVLLFVFYKSASKKFDLKILPPVLLLVAIAVFPASAFLITLLFILLAGISDSSEKTVNLLGESAAKPAVFLISLPILVGLGLIYFFGYKAVAAEYTYAKSFNSLASNDAKQTYNLMTSAIAQNPKVDRYHASLAQVDMALASSLANNLSAQTGKDTIEADKSTITQLIQQAIGEGKAAVATNPQRSGNWEILAQIYKNIMSFATGADQFTIQTYTQAIAFDPINPNLRIALGGVYYALGRYDDAIDAFKLAVIAKPDLANAHYNLAIAYREKKNFDNAIAEMNAVLSLVEKDSPDYALAKTELDNLERNKNIKETVGTQNLNPPQPAQEPVITPPLELPEEATPPASQ